MAVREIVTYPDSVLTEPTEEVDATSEETHALVQDLLDTVNAEGGLGLAAPQIGVSKRVCVVRYEGDHYVYVNPEVSKTSGPVDTQDEGCLSFPGVSAPVERHDTIIVTSDSPKGDRRWIDLSGMLARIVQHEVDHLDGVLFIDHLSDLQRRLVMKQYRKVQKRLQRGDD